jgi:photosystem II stability/assembly factor-like uncharacterized protein
MPSTELYAATTKGIFRYRSDANRKNWTMEGPMLPGWEAYSVLRLRDGRLLAGTSHFSYGATVRMSDDNGASWVQGTAQPAYPADKGWKLTKIWQLVQHPTDDRIVYAGVDEAGLFVSHDRGDTWKEVDSLTSDPMRPKWFPGGGGLCLHTILIDPKNPNRMWLGISAVGAFRSDDGGQSWKNLNKTLPGLPTGADVQDAACCVHKMVLDPADSNTLLMQYHGGVLRSRDSGDHWERIENGLPGNFGFPMVMTSKGEAMIIPEDSDEKRFMKNGQLAVYKLDHNADTWKPVTSGFPKDGQFTGVLRDSMCVDGMPTPGAYFGTITGEVYASNDSGQNWARLPGQLPRVTSVRCYNV